MGFLRALSMVMGLASLTPLSVVFADPPKSSAEVRAQLLRLKQEIAAVNAVISEKSTERDRIDRDLQAASVKVAATARALLELNSKLHCTKLELEALGVQERDLKQGLARERAELSKLLRSAYAIGQLEQVKLALSQEKVAKVGRVLAYHSYVNQSRIRAIDRIQTGLKALIEIRSQINEKQVTLNALIAAEQAQAQVLEQERAARSKIVARLNAELQSGQQRLTALSADEQRLNDLLGRLSDLLSDIPKVLPNAQAFAAMRGRLPHPLGRKTEVLREFGTPSSIGKPATGAFLQASVGSPVYAIASGRVAYADWLRGFGLLMVIDHGDGYLSLYGHCERLEVGEGEWVDSAKQIGVSGDTSDLGPGLHFELRQRARAINPMRWLAER
jgi:murein hydrolase activator